MESANQYTSSQPPLPHSHSLFLSLYTSTALVSIEGGGRGTKVNKRKARYGAHRNEEGFPYCDGGRTDYYCIASCGVGSRESALEGEKRKD